MASDRLKKCEDLFFSFKLYLEEKAPKFSDLDELKSRLNNSRPLSKTAARNLRQDLILKWTHHSTAIEGNSLTLNETKVVLERGLTIGGKSMKDHLEIINHKDAILFIEEMIQDKKILIEGDIKDIHSIVLRTIDSKNAGHYRKENVKIIGAKDTPPHFLHVPEKMSKLIEWYENSAPDLHPVERSAHIHTHFAGIHPFIDGNGRVARLLLNFELLKSGFPAIVIEEKDRSIYYDGISQAILSNDYALLINMISNKLKEAFDEYWRLLEDRIES